MNIFKKWKRGLPQRPPKVNGEIAESNPKSRIYQNARPTSVWQNEFIHKLNKKAKNSSKKNKKTREQKSPKKSLAKKLLEKAKRAFGKNQEARKPFEKK